MNPIAYQLVSYNVLGGVFYEKIIQGLKDNQVKPDIVCFQEFPEDNVCASSFHQFLGSEFANIKNPYLSTPKRMLATFYNKRKFKLQQSKIIYLPKFNYSLWERLFLWSVLYKTPKYHERIAIITVFDQGGAKITIVNTHLDWNGGIEHRINQLQCILRELRKLEVLDGLVICCGDFNISNKSNSGQIFLEEFRQYKFDDLTSIIPYTCDFASPYLTPVSKTRPVTLLLNFFAKFLSKIGINTKVKIDYVFGRNLTRFHASTIQVEGSDHYPILVNSA